MLLTRTVTGDPVVSLASAKVYQKIDTDASDATLTTLIDSATYQCERYTGREFRANTYELLLEAFANPIALKVSPVASVTKVEYLASSVWTTVSAATYDLCLGSPWSEIVLADEAEWPDADLIDLVPQPVRVTFVSGVHNGVSQAEVAIQRCVAQMHEHLGDSDDANADGITGRTLAIDAMRTSGAATILDQVRVARV